MARLARDVDLGPRRREAVLRAVVALLQVRRMALGAHVVPILLRPGPVQFVARRHPLVRVQVVPALPAGLSFARVPRDRERLQPAATEVDQVLLQRGHAEHVGDREVAQHAVGAVRAHDEAFAVAEERRRHVVVRERHLGEVAEHGRRARRLHRQIVVGSFERSRLGRMAARTTGPPDVAGRRAGRGRSSLERQQHHARTGERHQGQQPRTAQHGRLGHAGYPSTRRRKFDCRSRMLHR